MRDKHARRRILILENQVSRWDLSIQAQQDAMLQKFKDGDYVTYADYQKLEAERDALKESHAELVDALQAVIEYGTWIGDGWIPDEEVLDKAQATINKVREKMG